MPDSLNSGIKTKWADIVFTETPYGKFTYEIPQKFQEILRPGQRVQVRLGKRLMSGFLVEFVPKPDFKKIRPIEDILDPEPLLSPSLLKLTRWIASYYMSSWGEAIRAALPPGIQRRSSLMITATDAAYTNLLDNLPAEALQMLATIRDKGTISFQNLKRRHPFNGARFILAKLEKSKAVSVEHVIEDARSAPKFEKWISLQQVLPADGLEALRKRAPKQAAAIDQLLKAGKPLPRSALKCQLPVLKQLHLKKWINIVERETTRTPFADLEITPAPDFQLSPEQSVALGMINAGMAEEIFKVFLIHGVTGSGKTQVYIEAIRKTLQRGKTALILIPEISLTPQAVQRYRAAFGDEVAILHSRMSPGERYDSWRQIKAGKFKIALGPRSAVFAPLDNIGIIVIDEEHDSSYKQSDPAPRYHARDVAIMQALENKCLVLLGSATPSLESYYNALNKKYSLCQLMSRIDNTPMPLVKIVSLKDDDGQEAGLVFSDTLIESMNTRMELGEQVIILQNRRGYSTFLRCKDCTAVAKCEHCDISLTFHQVNNLLKCHYCGYQRKSNGKCSECGGVSLQYQGVGTQRVQEALITIFPQAEVLRMDQDSTRTKDAHARIIEAFEAGKGDILLGTQMIAKGHDFSNVNLVGIISADTGMHFPDFRAGERTFQLLTQTAGRAGRRDQQGEVIIQTRTPDHPILELARRQDYIKFYKREIEQRRGLGYPPWGKLAIIRFKGKNEAAVQKTGILLRSQIHDYKDITVLGPAPCPITRIKQLYRYQIILRSPRTSDPAGNKIRSIIRKGLASLQKKNLPFGVRISVDIDPVDIL